MQEQFDSNQERFFEPQLGAEAVVELTRWDGELAISKVRKAKSYRDPDLDKRIRTKRTKEEIQIMHFVKLSGVDTPEILFGDPETSVIVMSYIKGAILKDLLSVSDKKSLIGWFQRLGTYVGLMHSKNLIHGDLTTKNLIVSGERLVLIDFGLSFYSSRIEDVAEDIHLLKQALNSSNPKNVAGYCFRNFFESYGRFVGGSKKKLVLQQIRKIELRGRYAKVD